MLRRQCSTTELRAQTGLLYYKKLFLETEPATIRNEHMSRRFLIIIAGIFLLALFLRFYSLVEYPAGFHIDEVTMGWNAYSILKTGRDETGRFLPLYSTSFSLDRAIGNFILTAISINFLGLSQFAVRFPYALFGFFTIVLSFFFIKQLTKSNQLALISTLLIAISPWHIALSRASSETTVTLFLIMLGHFLYLKAITHQKFIFLILGWLFLTSGLLFYHSAVGFVFFSTVVLCVWTHFFQSTKVRSWAYLTLICITALTVAFFIFGKGGAQRFNQVGFQQDASVTYELDKMKFEEGPLHVLRARLFHNKVVVYTRALIKNYFDYFSINYLFISGGKPPRYLPPAIGVLHLFELPFFFVGLYLLARRWNSYWLLIFGLLLVSPLVASLTSEYTPNLQRSFFMVPYIETVIGYGLWQSLRKMRKQKLVVSFFTLIMLLNLVYYLHQYYIHLPVHDPQFRNDGATELATTVMSLKSQFDTILITKYPEPPYHYFFFFSGLDPQEFQKTYVPLIHSDSEWTFDKNIVFTSTDCPSKVASLYPGNLLIVNHSLCEWTDAELKLLKNITRKDGSVVYQLLVKK